MRTTCELVRMWRSFVESTKPVPVLSSGSYRKSTHNHLWVHIISDLSRVGAQGLVRGWEMQMQIQKQIHIHILYIHAFCDNRLAYLHLPGLDKIRLHGIRFKVYDRT